MNYPELLDFCRVKKFNEKGFGFLRGIYHEKDIFFHLSSIKNEIFREKFLNLVRGSFFLFFISTEQDGKLKVKKFWYSLEEVPASYFPAFIFRIFELFETGKTNLFDLLYVFGELKRLNLISSEQIDRLLNSQRIKSSPVAIIPYLSREEISLFSEIMNIEKLNNLPENEKPFWLDEYNEKCLL